MSEFENEKTFIDENMDPIPAGVSMESASYIESKNDNSSLTSDADETVDTEFKKEEVHTPQLFSDENVALSENNYDEDMDGHNDNTEKLFEQESREEEDFELHVSSAGLDKPFRHINQYKKNIGRMVKVKPLDSSKIEGLLSIVDEKGIVIIHSEKKRIEGKKKKEIVEEEFRFDFDKIKETKIVISFK